MEQSDPERAEHLLKTIEMVMKDAEREANPQAGYVDFSTAYQAIAELRELIEEG